MLVYGDTNSTLAGAIAARQAGIPAGHVEAGMRSFDREMPEELNRVLTDHASDVLLCSTETAVRNLAREGVAGEVHLVGDVMADVSLAFRDIAEERSSHPGGARRRARLLPGGDGAPGRQRGPARAAREARRAARRDAAAGRLPRASAHPPAARGRRPHGPAWETCASSAPLGYLDFLKLARHARAVLTDSGGVQKEAYLLGVPCMTLRDTTEWVETVESGWNVLVDLDADAALAALGRESARGAARALRRRPRGGTRLRGPRVLHSAPMKIGVVGLGYVGLPLAVAFCEAGHEVVGRGHGPAPGRGAVRRPLARRGRAGRVASGDRLAPARDHAVRRPRQGRRDHRGGPDPAHAQPRARPAAADRGGHGARGGAAAGPAGRPRVDHLPGHDARPVRSAARGVRARRGARLPRRVLAGAVDPGPHRLHAAQHAEGRRRPDGRVPRAAPSRSTARSATRSSRSRRPRPPSSRSCSRTSSAR